MRLTRKQQAEYIEDCIDVGAKINPEALDDDLKALAVELLSLSERRSEVAIQLMRKAWEE